MRILGSLAPDPPIDWAREEMRVRRRMQRQLASYLAIARESESLAFDLVKDLPEPRKAPEVIRVHLTLLARVIQDLRVSVLAAVRGYTMQSWTVAASCFEAAHSMGFVGDDVERARRWLEHSSLRRGPWQAYAGVEGSLKYLEVGESTTARAELVRREYELYEYLCLAKHINPIPERTRYVVRVGSSIRLLLTPFFTDRRVREARLGLALGIRAAFLALWVLHRTHYTERSAFASRLLALASNSEILISSWREITDDAG